MTIVRALRRRSPVITARRIDDLSRNTIAICKLSGLTLSKPSAFVLEHYPDTDFVAQRNDGRGNWKAGKFGQWVTHSAGEDGVWVYDEAELDRWYEGVCACADQ